MSKHTPGPWEVVPTYWARSPYETEDAPRRVSTYWVKGLGAMGIYGEADAYLIAAAPDMYAALVAIVEQSQKLQDAGVVRDRSADERWKQAKAAIAKATGAAQ